MSRKTGPISTPSRNVGFLLCFHFLSPFLGLVSLLFVTAPVFKNKGSSVWLVITTATVGNPDPL
jgi:hypothetical protein